MKPEQDMDVFLEYFRQHFIENNKKMIESSIIICVMKNSSYMQEHVF